MPCSCPPSSAPRDEPAPIGGHRRCLSGSRPGRRLSTDRHQPDARSGVEGLDAETYTRLADEAKAGCPVSKALAGVEIAIQIQTLTLG